MPQPARPTKLAILIEDPRALSEHVEEEMRRWWRQKCVKHTRPPLASDLGPREIWVVRGKFNLYEGVKRLKSFGVVARVIRFSPERD